MAILLRGKTRCRLCGDVITDHDEATMFPSGLFTPSEPVFEVNDAAVHTQCVRGWEHGDEALARRADYLRRVDAHE